MIACLYIARFAVEAERARHPEIVSRLLLIGEATVLDCSLGAEASGVRPGIRMSEAIGLCHNAIVLPPDMPYYNRLFEEMLDHLQELSPEIEGDSSVTGLAYIALRGLPVQLGPFAEQLIAGVHRCFGFMPSVGIAGGKFVARVAARISRPGAARIVPRDGEAEFLAPLPVSHLPASDALSWRLAMLGIEKIGQVATMPLGAFQAQFGPEGRHCWELAQGIDSRPLVPRIKEETITRRLQLPAPAVSLDAVMVGVERLVHAAYGEARQAGRWVRKVTVRGGLDPAGTWELPVAFREALADPRDAWFAIKAAIVRRPPERPVEELEVQLVGLSAESGKQAVMFEGKGRLWRQVEEAVRQIGMQREQPRLGRVMPLEPWSRIPERRAALVELSDV